ncbi:unnamed protein product [Cercopithifilaria johnstoni]|uniref:Uncharacterized protein n=1 Tax=Cercopithifilaria johnstoni TaxID=2874296 RepID=A0A8J2MH89_9BILA|nr:unnamed protein product [Cercopithifilaria johnstoni]
MSSHRLLTLWGETLSSKESNCQQSVFYSISEYVSLGSDGYLRRRDQLGTGTTSSLTNRYHEGAGSLCHYLIDSTSTDSEPYITKQLTAFGVFIFCSCTV